MADKLVLLRTVESEADAAIATAVLEANGIPAETRVSAEGFGIYRTTLAGPTDILVRSYDVERARELLDLPPKSGKRRG